MTSKLPRDDIEFLLELLPPLLKRFGKEELVRVINEIGDSRPEYSLRRAAGAGEIPRDRNRSSQRPTAVVIAERTDAPPRKKTLLVNLASQFDRKAFLPTLPDIRHFLEMRGQNLGSVKQRGDAFRKIASAVIRMSDEALEQLVDNSRYSGPSQLGPLSDAIKAVSAAGRSDRTSSNLFDGNSAENDRAGRSQTSHDSAKSGGEATSDNEDVKLSTFDQPDIDQAVGKHGSEQAKMREANGSPEIDATSAGQVDVNAPKAPDSQARPAADQDDSTLTEQRYRPNSRDGSSSGRYGNPPNRRR